jgi:DNA-binding transcriptional LysR family regulator
VRLTNVFDNIDTLKNAVAVTDQVAIVPKRTAMREAAAGTLAVVDLVPRLRRPLGIIHRRRSGAVQVLPPAVQSFVDVLLERAGPDVDASGKMRRKRRKLAGGRA